MNTTYEMDETEEKWWAVLQRVNGRWYECREVLARSYAEAVDVVWPGYTSPPPGWRLEVK